VLRPVPTPTEDVPIRHEVEPSRDVALVGLSFAFDRYPDLRGKRPDKVRPPAEEAGSVLFRPAKGNGPGERSTGRGKAGPSEAGPLGLAVREQGAPTQEDTHRRRESLPASLGLFVEHEVEGTEQIRDNPA
jgi:hypothetical protein